MALKRRNSAAGVGLIIIILLCLCTDLKAQTAQDYYQKANRYAQANRYSEAIEEYNKALKLNPYYKEAYNKLGQAYLARNFPEKALICLEKAISLDPDYKEAYNNLGQAYETSGKLTKAEAIYRQVLKLDPVDLEAHFNLARVLNKQGRPQKSIQEYERAIKIDPHHFPSYIKLGDVYFKSLHKPDQAIFYYQKAKEINPLDETPYLRLAALYRQEGFLDRAKAQYQAALKLNSSSIDGLNQLGLLSLHEKDYDAALHCYDKLLDFIPSNPLAHYTMAMAYKGQGLYPEAIAELNKTLELDPYNEMALFQKGKILLFLAPVPVSSPSRKETSRSHLKLADYYYENRLLDLAKYEYRNALRLNPQDFEARFNLARLYEKEELLDSAIEELRRVIELEPNLTQAKEKLDKLIWLNETRLATKERISLDTIPPPVDKLLINLYPEQSYHPEIGLATTEMAILFLKQYPHFELIEQPYQEKEFKSLIPLAEQEGAQFVLFGDVREDEQNFRIEAKLINLKNPRPIAHFALPLKGNYKMAGAIALLAQKTAKAFPVQGKIIRIVEDIVIINLGKIHGLGDNQILDIFRAAPYGLKTQEQKIGQMKIIQADQEISKARIIPFRAVSLVRLNDRVKPVLTKKKPKSKK